MKSSNLNVAKCFMISLINLVFLLVFFLSKILLNNKHTKLLWFCIVLQHSPHQQHHFIFFFSDILLLPNPFVHLNKKPTNLKKIFSPGIVTKSLSPSLIHYSKLMHTSTGCANRCLRYLERYYRNAHVLRLEESQLQNRSHCWYDWQLYLSSLCHLS